MKARANLKQSFFQVTLTYFLVLGISIFPSLPYLGADSALAADKKTLTEDNYREITKALFENVRSKKDVIGTLHTAQVSLESIKTIEQDLSKRLPDSAVLPKLAVEKDALIVDGKETGLRFLSYSPMKIKYQGRIWTPQSHATADDNYKSLVRFLEKPRVFSWISLIVPEAKAFWGAPNMGMGALSGSIIGVFGGMTLGMLTGGDGIQMALYGAGVGAIFGGLMGLNNQRNRPQQQNQNTVQ